MKYPSGGFLVNFLIALHQNLTAEQVFNILESHTTQNSIGQRFDR